MFTGAPPLYSKPSITQPFLSQDVNQNQRCAAPYLNQPENQTLPIGAQNDYADPFGGQNHETGFPDRNDNPRYYPTADTNTASIKRPLLDQDDRLAVPPKKAWDGGSSIQRTDNDNFTYQCIDYGHGKLSSSVYDGGTADQSSFKEFKSAPPKEKAAPDRPKLTDKEFFLLFEAGLDTMIRTDNSVQAILDSDTRLNHLLSPLFKSQNFGSITDTLGDGEEAVAAKKLQKLVSLTKKKIQFLCSKIKKSFSDGQKDPVEQTEQIKKPEKRISLRKKKSKEHAKLCRSIIRSYRDEHDRRKLISQELRKSPDVSPQIPRSQTQYSLPVRPTAPYPLMVPDVSKPPYQPNLLPDVSQPQYPPSLLPSVSRPPYPPSLLPTVSRPPYPPSLLPDVSRPPYPPSLLPDVSRPPYPPSLLPDVSRLPYPPSLLPTVGQVKYSLPITQPPGVYPGTYVPIPPPLIPRSSANSNTVKQPQVSQAVTSKKKQKARNSTSCLRQIELVSLKKKTKNVPASTNLVMVKDNEEDGVAVEKKKKKNAGVYLGESQFEEDAIITRNRRRLKKKLKKPQSQMTPTEKLSFLVMNLKSFKVPSDKARFLEKLFDRIGRSFLNVNYMVIKQSGFLFGSLSIDKLFITRRKADNDDQLWKIVHERAYNVLWGFPVELIISLGDPNQKDKKILKEERFNTIIDLRRIKTNSSKGRRGKIPARIWLHRVCCSLKRPLTLRCEDQVILGSDSVEHTVVKIMLNDSIIGAAKAPSLDLATEKAYNNTIQRMKTLSAHQIAYEKGLLRYVTNSAEKGLESSEKEENVPTLTVKEKFEKIKLLLKKYPQNQTRTMKERYLNSIADGLKIPHSLVFRRTYNCNTKIICSLFFGETFVASTKDASITKARAAVYDLAWNLLSRDNMPFGKCRNIKFGRKTKFIEWKETGGDKKSKTVEWNKLGGDEKSETVSADVINKFIKENKKEPNKKSESASDDVTGKVSIKDETETKTEVVSEDVINEFSIKDETEPAGEPENVSEDVVNEFFVKDEPEQDENPEFDSEDVIDQFCIKDEVGQDEEPEIASEDVIEQYCIKDEIGQDEEAETVCEDVTNQFCIKDETETEIDKEPENVSEDMTNSSSLENKMETSDDK